MNDVRLRNELDRVSERFTRLAFLRRLAIGWAVLGAGGVFLLVRARSAGGGVPLPAAACLTAAAALWPVLLQWFGTPPRPAAWVARRIERRYPDLDSRLLAAVEQRPDAESNELGFLQQTLIGEAVDHAEAHPWADLVSPRQLRLASAARWATFAFVLGVVVVMGQNASRAPARPAGPAGVAAAPDFKLRVEPEDTEVERGASLIVMARFGTDLPADVELLYHDPSGQAKQMPMARSLNDPLFAARIPAVTAAMDYAVRFGGEQTRWYKVGVFDYPDLKKADAKLKYPEYTGQPEKVIEDTLRVTAVEGTRASFVLHLNKPVAEATLTPRPTKNANPTKAPAPLKLQPDPANPGDYTIAFDLKQSEKYQLNLVDKDGRKNRNPAPELAVNVLPNAPANLKLTWPGRDVDASPLQELSLKAEVRDDFGVRRAGVSYGLAGATPQEAVLAENVAGGERREVIQLVPLEKLSAEPDGLLSYFFWAEDVGPDGSVRRTASDMFFAEIRPFEEIYRQGQQPSASEQEQQRQQQQQQQGAGQNGQQAEELAEVQKQIVSATWKVIRRETAAAPTPQFVPDVKAVADAQASAREQAEALGEKLTDDKSKALLDNVLKSMDKAKEQLTRAGDGPAVKELAPALSAEQAVYQALLKLRAREFEVVRANQRQRGQQQQQQRASASSRRQRQLNQLDLNSEENRYETQRSANPAQQQQEQDGQRETRQVLSRLKELAQRQEDLNRQMRDLQTALQQARDAAQREEIQRQLARLRDQQQQQLRDTDELRDRMDQPENQERMADARQQLEKTREDVRQSAESLEQGQLADAAARGARAQEQLNKLRDDFRTSASGQIQEAMNQMRQDARRLDQNQQDLTQRLSAMNAPATQPAAPRGLRDGGEREQIASGLRDQRQQLDRLLDNMRQTVDQSEATEPLLSKELYDTVRKAAQESPETALDLSRQMLDRGLVDEARQAGTDAGKGIAQVRKGVEKAAETVLGGQTDALRRARGELDQLARELDREAAARGTADNGRPATRPAGEQIASAQNPAGRQPGGRQGEGQERGQGQEGEQGQPQASDQPDEQGAQPGNRGRQGNARGGQQPGDQPGEGQQPGRRGQGQGQQPGTEPGEQGEGQQPGDQPGEGRGGQQGRGQGRNGRGQGQQADAGEDGQNPQSPGGRGGRGQQPGRGGARGGQGEQGQNDPAAEDAQPADGQGQQPGEQAGPPGNGRGRGGLRGGPQQADANGRGGQRRGGNPQPGGQRQQGADGGGATGPQPGPITGENFRDWSDRLRDVEEMVDDPDLRARAAQIRDRAREMRGEFNRHSKPPTRDMIADGLMKPLAELRSAVNQELMKRESGEALVPIDREPLPPKYAAEIREYYERLGSGK